ncbi:MAG: hypothetical protein IKV00_05780 [Clostridia bacterium]|nr:hypothetical protein [Clostridia bacterium]
MEQNVQMEQIVHTEDSKKKDKTLEKSLMSALVLLVVTLGFFTAQTYAYFVESTTSSENNIIAGHMEVEVISVHDDDGGETDYSAIPTKIMPGSSVTRGDVIVKNAGSLPMYVRIYVEKTIFQSENEISADLDSLIYCNFSTDGTWVYQDGYYYYTDALAPGELTTALFDTVIFSPNMGNEFKNSKLQFKVICQSVQSNGNSDDPLTAWGWPSAATAE